MAGFTNTNELIGFGYSRRQAANLGRAAAALRCDPAALFGHADSMISVGDAVTFHRLVRAHYAAAASYGKED